MLQLRPVFRNRSRWDVVVSSPGPGRSATLLELLVDEPRMELWQLRKRPALSRTRQGVRIRFHAVQEIE